MSIASQAATQSAEERPIGMSTRADLFVQQSVYQGENCWIVKDPLAMKYFRLKRPEYLVFEALREPQSYLELKRLLDHEFPESITRLESLQHLVTSLHANGLLRSPSAGQAKPLRKRHNKDVKQKVMQLTMSVMSLRLPGFDPEWILNFLYPKIRWAFSTWFTCVVWAVCLAAAALVLGNLEEFYARLPDFQSFFAFDNLLFLGAILIFTKTIHEFGHGLMCKHYGGECHEIGFMFLVMTPAMYCNTSDSWILPNRWHRMAIGAGGIYVEIFMAAICTFIWWFTVPSWIHFLALNIMFLSSVSTILFNANPLLRYDGYYVLSDFLEIPNLAQKSKLALTSTLRVWCLGMEPVNSASLPKRNIIAFAIYSVASFVYRWLVMLFIFWFIKTIFEPLGLGILGYLLICFSLVGMVVVPLYKMVKFFLYPGRFRDVKRFNTYCTLIVLASLIAFVCYYPFSHYVHGDCLVRPSAGQTVFVQEPGTLVSVNVSAGDRVQKGDVLAILENPNFDLELKSLQGEVEKLRHDLSGYELNRSVYLDSASLITQTRLGIQNLDEQISLKRLQADPLYLKAPRDGVIVAPPNLPESQGSTGELRLWSGTPLEKKNVGAFLERNTVLCTVADEKKFEAILVFDQSNINLLANGQQAKFLIEAFRDHPFEGAVVSVSQDSLASVPRELSQSNGGPVAVIPSATGEKPVLNLFEAQATISAESLKEQQVQLGSGLYGKVKVKVGNASLGSMAVRAIRNLVNFR